MNSTITLGATTVLVIGTLLSHDASSTTNACWFDADVLKEKYSVTVPEGRRDEFVRYLREDVPNDMLSRSEVESERALTIILQNVDSGILAIDITNVKPKLRFDIEVKTCDFTQDWRPFWQYVKGKIDSFLIDRSVGGALERTRRG